jgi:hypothetical protein
MVYRSMLGWMVCVCAYGFFMGASTELVLDDGILDSIAWCPKMNCYKNLSNSLWGPNSNECNMHSDCFYKDIQNYECGFPYFTERYIHASDSYCVPMGGLGKKYCTVGCTLYQTPNCHDTGGEMDSMYGNLTYCYMYYDTIIDEVTPVCQCYQSDCSTDLACPFNITSNIPKDVWYFSFLLSIFNY